MTRILAVFLTLAFSVSWAVSSSAAPGAEVSAPAPSVESRGHLFNLRYQVAGVISNSHILEADIAITRRITLGPIIGFKRAGFFDSKVNNLSVEEDLLGLGFHVFLNRGAFENGPYLKPYVTANRFTARIPQSGLEKSETGLSTGLIFAYQWIWSDFNIHLGAGGEVRSTPDTAKYRKDSSGERLELSREVSSLSLAGDFTLGFAF